MALVYRYGALTHTEGEVIDHRITNVAHHTKRGWRDTCVRRVEQHIQVLGCTEAEVEARVQTILNYYYDHNDEKWGIYLDGAETHCIMDPASAQTIRGPMVVDVAFLSGSMEEMVVKREFSVTLEWMYLADESQIIEYDERISHFGNGALMTRWQNTVNLGPRQYIVWPSTTMTIVQEGTSLGLSNYYLAGAVPHPLIAPQYEHQERRIDQPGKPLHLGNKWLYYPWHWRFEFEVPAYTLVLPV